MEELCRKCENLGDLRLRSGKINDYSIESIVKYCKKLHTLDLQECVSVSKEALFLILDGVPALQQLNLIGVPIATSDLRDTLQEKKRTLLKVLINPPN